MTDFEKPMVNDCGSCTLCCKLLAVTEVGKVENVWCSHCNIGTGCRIYDTRPQSCRTFECAWLQSQRTDTPLPEEMKPEYSKVVLTDGKESVSGAAVTLALVDPSRPNAWKDGAIAGHLQKLIRSGAKLVIVIGREKRAYNLWRGAD